MNKLEAIAASKQFRKDADDLLQRMKEHTKQLTISSREVVAGTDECTEEDLVNAREVIAQHIISTRDLESCIMRQGMVLKNIGGPPVYPGSYDPNNPVVHPPSGVKL